MIWRGRVERRLIAPGSKSEHEGLVLLTSDGQHHRLRRQGGNAFRDATLDALEGHQIECEGILRDGQLIITRWTVLA